MSAIPVPWIACLSGVGIAAVAGVADWRRVRRDDPDRVGAVDWRSVQLFALMAAMICAGVAFKA